MFEIKLYNEEFFEWHLIHAREYSISNMNWFIDEYKPNSVIDFGCGIGSYLEAAYNKGLRDLVGLDISDHAKKFTPDYLHDFIEYKDCTRKIIYDAKWLKWDCVISFETIEHIETNGSGTFLDNLVNATDKYLLFTGAPPGQGGLGHINCQTKEHWIEEITKRGMKLDKVMTEHVSKNWKRLGCPYYIEQNLLIFKP